MVQSILSCRGLSHSVEHASCFFLQVLQRDDDKHGQVLDFCLHVMIIKLDTLAVPAKHAMLAKTRVEQSFPPFLPLKEGKQN